MPLFLSEADVQELFPMSLALERVEASFRAQHGALATNRSRERIILPREACPDYRGGLFGVLPC